MSSLVIKCAVLPEVTLSLKADEEMVRAEFRYNTDKLPSHALNVGLPLAELPALVEFLSAEAAERTQSSGNSADGSLTYGFDYQGRLWLTGHDLHAQRQPRTWFCAGRGLQRLQEFLENQLPCWHRRRVAAGPTFGLF